MDDLPFRLTIDAKNDLESIARYTKKKWGKAQALKQADLIDIAFFKIADGKDKAKSTLADDPSIFVCRCEHHYIFYWRPESEKEKPVIIAVLHERMDLIHRIKERLPA